MTTSTIATDASETPLARSSFALVFTLLARSFGLAAGVAMIVLLVAALLLEP